MKKLFFLILNLMFACLLLPAQEKPVVKKALSVSLTGSVLNTPRLVAGIQPGIQYQLDKRWAFLVEMGIRIQKDEDSSYSKSRYFRLSGEAKYFLGEREKNINRYVSCMAMYAKRNWNDLNAGGYEKRDDSLSYLYSSAIIKSPVFVICAKYGMEVRLSNKLVFECFAGLGARVIATRYNAENIRSSRRIFYSSGKILPSPDPAYFNNETQVRLHFTTGMRLYYNFLNE